MFLRRRQLEKPLDNILKIEQGDSYRLTLHATCCSFEQFSVKCAVLTSELGNVRPLVLRSGLHAHRSDPLLTDVSLHPYR